MKKQTTTFRWLRASLVVGLVLLYLIPGDAAFAMGFNTWGGHNYTPKKGRLHGITETTPTYQPGAIGDDNLIVSTEPYLQVPDLLDDEDIEIYFGNNFERVLAFNKLKNQFEFSEKLYVRGHIFGSGDLIVTGGVALNADKNGHAVIRFGNNIKDELFGFDQTNDLFYFSDDAYVNGNLHSQTLTVDGVMNIRGVDYIFSNEQGSAGQILKLSGSGELLWANDEESSIVHLAPNFPNSSYYGDGSSNVGQLKLSRDTENNRNHYTWSTTNAVLQDYTIAIEYTLPDNFTTWGTTPITVDYKTNTGSADDAKIGVRVFNGSGTADTALANLANNSWSTGSITSLTQAYAAGDTITLLIDVFSTSGNPADVGRITLDYI